LRSFGDTNSAVSNVFGHAKHPACINGSMVQCFSFGRNFVTWWQNKRGREGGEFESYKGFLLRKNGIKSPYFEGEKKKFARFWPQLQGSLPEYLVGFKTILLCSLACSQTWLSPLLEACQSTYLTNLRKKEKSTWASSTLFMLFSEMLKI